MKISMTEYHHWIYGPVMLTIYSYTAVYGGEMSKLNIRSLVHNNAHFFEAHLMVLLRWRVCSFWSSLQRQSKTWMTVHVGTCSSDFLKCWGKTMFLNNALNVETDYQNNAFLIHKHIQALKGCWGSTCRVCSFCRRIFIAAPNTHRDEWFHVSNSSQLNVYFYVPQHETFRWMYLFYLFFVLCCQLSLLLLLFFFFFLWGGGRG